MKALGRVLLLGIILLGYTACKEDEIYDSEEQFIQDTTLIEAYLAQNNIEAQVHSSGIRYVINQEGTGANAAYGSTVVVKYTGYLLDGTEFDSNVGGSSFDFVIGQGSVIQGWDIGFKLLNKGTVATLYIPSVLAYGKNPPYGSEIPVSANLKFDVQVLNIR